MNEFPTTSTSMRSWAGVTAVLFLIMTATPFLDGGASAFEGGPPAVWLILSMLVPLTVGAVAARSEVLGALACGVTPFVTGFSFLVVSSISVVLRLPGVEVDAGPGFVFAIFVIVAGAILFIMGTTWMSESEGSHIGDGVRIIGIISSFGLALGIMLPAPDSFLTFKQQNFEFGDSFVQFGWLAFIAGVLIGPLVGFTKGTRRGLGFAAGGLTPIVWLFFQALVELQAEEGQQRGFGTVLRDDIHPVLTISVIAAVGALVIGLSQTAGATSPEPGSSALQPENPVASRPVGEAAAVPSSAPVQTAKSASRPTIPSIHNPGAEPAEPLVAPVDARSQLDETTTRPNSQPEGS